MYTYPSLLSHPLPISIFSLSPSFSFSLPPPLYFASVSQFPFSPFLFLSFFLSSLLSPSLPLYLSLSPSLPSLLSLSIFSSILTLPPPPSLSLSPSPFVCQWYIQLTVYTSQLMFLMDPISYL